MPSCNGTIYGQTWRISASPSKELVFKPVMREILRESLSIKGWTSSAIQAVLEVLRLEMLVISELGSFPNTLALANYIIILVLKLWHLYSWLMNLSYHQRTEGVANSLTVSISSSLRTSCNNSFCNEISHNLLGMTARARQARIRWVITFGQYSRASNISKKNHSWIN